MAAQFTIGALKDAAGITTELAAKWHAPLSVAMPLANIITADRIAMFLAQCGHESGGFKQVEESLNYTPEALLSMWPSRFAHGLHELHGRTRTQAANQKAIGIIAYGGRMGNLPAPSDDGYKYRGRGLIQVTGLDNYRAFGNWWLHSPAPASVGFVLDKPESLAQPENAALSAAWFWQANNLNKWADLGDVLTCSRVINLGSATSKATPNGLEDRKARYKRALAVMRG
jgi:putative chitinase